MRYIMEKPQGRLHLVLCIVTGFLLKSSAGNPPPLDLVVSWNKNDQYFSAAALYQEIDVNFDFDIVITNQDVNKKYQKVSSQTSSNNFDVKVLLADYDASMTAAPDATSSKVFEVTLSSATQAVGRNEIISGRSVKARGSTVIKIESAICIAITHLCVGIEVSTNPAQLTDHQTLNNYACAKLEDWGLQGCTDDTVDLRADVFDVVVPIVESGGAIAVELLLWVELTGAARSQPFAVHVYLCTSNSLDTSRCKQLELTPTTFTRTQEEFTTSQSIDLSGPGVGVGNLHTTVEDSKYCGAVYLAILIDGPGQGTNAETHEDNNVKIVPMMVLCPDDILSIKDFEYDMGQNQTQLYIDTDTPLNVNVTVCNSHHMRKPFYYGRANFKFEVFLHTSQDFLLPEGRIHPEALNVSRRGLTYPLGVSPIQACDVGECLRIERAQMYINGTKFQEYRPYKYIAMLALPAEGSYETDEILRNNYILLPIAVSDSKISTSLKDHKISDDFNVPADILEIYAPVAYSSLDFTGEIIVQGTVSGTMVAVLFWSKDCRWDPDDPRSSIQVGIEVSIARRRQIQPNDGVVETIIVSTPEDISYCGTVCAILTFHSSDHDDDILERNRNNQFGMDWVTLKCHATDVLGLTELWLVSPPTLWKDIRTPITFTVTVSCTADPCPSSRVKFHLGLFIDNGATKESLALLNSNSHSDIISYTGEGLETSLDTDRRVTLTFTVEVAVTRTCLTRTQKLGVQVIYPGGAEWTDNNYLSADLPLFRCVHQTSIDLEAVELTLRPRGPEIKTSQRIPYEFTFKLDVKGLPRPKQNRPHFRMSMLVSSEKRMTSTTYRLLSYQTPEHHKLMLSEEFKVGLEQLKFLDYHGLQFPADGLERFCDPDTGVATVYLGLHLDSYDPDPEDWITGQLAELLEHNNIAWTSTAFNVSGVNCHLNSVVERKLVAEIRDVTMKSGSTRVRVSVVLSSSPVSFEIEVGIINTFSEKLEPGEGLENFDLRVQIDVLNTTTNVIILNSKHILLLRKAPIEAGGTLTFYIEGKLCPLMDVDKGCGPSNVLEADFNSQDGCIIHTGDISVSFIQDPVNYVTAGDSVSRRVVCAGESFVADFGHIGVPDTIMGSGGTGIGMSPWYGFPFTVFITRYVALAVPDTGPVPQSAEFYFRFVNESDQVLRTEKQSVTLSINNGETMKLSGMAILEEQLDEIDCERIRDHVYVQAVVSRNSGRASPSWLRLDNLAVICSEELLTDFVDLAVTDIILAESKVHFGYLLNYSLTVTADDRASSGNTSFTLEVYLSTGINFTYPHRHVNTFTGNGTTTFMSIAGHLLDLSGEQLAWFCAYRDVYLLAHVTKNEPLPVDPELLRNVGASPLYLYCHGDLLQLHNVDGLTDDNGEVPLYHSPEGYTNVFVITVTVRNSHFRMEDIEPGLRFRPNFLVEVHHRSNGEPWIPWPSVEVLPRDQHRLREGIAINQSVSVQVKVSANITDALCQQLTDGNGALRVVIYQGLGLPPDKVDSVLDNDVITYPVRCTQDIQDIDVSDPASLSLDTGRLTQSSNFDYFEQRRVTFSIFAYIGNGQSKVMNDTNLRYQLYVSRDNQPDPSDLELTLETLDASYHTVSDDPATPEPDRVTAFGPASPIITFPLEVGWWHCGRVYLLLVVNADRLFDEPDDTNNIAAVPITVRCDEDLYAFWEGQAIGQSIYYPDSPAWISFGGKVLNVGKAKAVNPAVDNFKLKVYAKPGAQFELSLATDITSTLEIPRDQLQYTRDYQDDATTFIFFGVTGTITIAQGVCADGVDHLFVGVMKENANQDDSILHDNFFVIPITVVKHPELGCGGMDSVDLEVKRHRNLQTTFEVAETQLTIGTEFSFQLQLLITVNGDGWKPHWETLPSEGKPVFDVIFTLTDGTYILIIPHLVDINLINSQITSTTSINLGSTLVLPEGGAVPLCGKTNLQLSVVIDPHQHVVETNEGNNRETISGISVVGDICSESSYDLTVKDFVLLPEPKIWVETERAAELQPILYTFTVETRARPGLNVGPPSSLTYSFVLSPNASILNIVQAEGGVTHTATTPTVTANVFTWTVSGNMTVQSLQSQDVQVLCGLTPYLGVYLDPDMDPANGAGVVPELDEDNNIGWHQIRLNCPMAEGISLADVVIHESGISDDAAGVPLTLDLLLINKGSSIDTTANGLSSVEVSLYARADTSLPAEYDYVDRIHVANPLNLRQAGRYEADWTTSEPRWYADIAVIGIIFPAAACTDSNYLCVLVRGRNSTSDPQQDNYVCIPFNRDFYLDCARDTSLGSLVMQLDKVAAIYQNTRIPMTYEAEVTFSGRSIPPNPAGSSHIGVQFYLSHNATLESTDILLTDAPMWPLDQPINDTLTSGSVLAVSGRTEVYVTHEQCAGDIFLCACYVFLTNLLPPYKEDPGTRSNDVTCVDVTDIVACNNETKDIVPTLLELSDMFVAIGDRLDFILNVEVDLRGMTTAGQVPFTSGFYLSLDEEFDDNDIRVTGVSYRKRSYLGWDYGIAHRELSRVLPGGLHYLNLGGIPLTLEDLPDTRHCGPVYLLCVADVGMNISERYEGNNVISAPIVVSCQGDVAGMTAMVDQFHVINVTLRIQSPLAAGLDTPVYLSADVYNVGPPLPVPSPTSPLYWMTLKTDADVVVSTVDGWEGVPNDVNHDMATGQKHQLWNLKVRVSAHLFTEDVCTAMTGLKFCVHRPEPSADEVDPVTETFLDNNCFPIPEGLFTKDCAANEHVDIRQVGLHVPQTFKLSDTVTLWHDVEVSLGIIAPAIATSQFISALYMSRSAILDLSTALHLTDIPNEIRAETNSLQSVRVTLVDASLTLHPDPEENCGLVYMFVVADSLKEVTETREDNNVGFQRLVLTCDTDYWTILDLTVDTDEGRFIEDRSVDFRFEFLASCSQSDCHIDQSLSSNIKFDLLYQNTNVTSAVTWATVDENWSGDVTPGINVGFKRPGLIRKFTVTGKLVLPSGTCLPNGQFSVGVRIDFGTDLRGLPTSTDGVMSNNVVLIPYYCTKGLNELDSRDLEAMPVTFINTSVEQGPNLPAQVRPGHAYHFSFRFQLSGAPLVVKDSAITDVPFMFRFYLSNDDRLDKRDLDLNYRLTEANAASLSRPMASTPVTVTVLENIRGIRFPDNECGMRHLLVHVDSTDRIVEISETNNVAAKQVYISCHDDIFSVLNATVRSGSVYQDTVQTILFDASLVNSGPHRITPDPGMPPLEVRAYLSADTVLQYVVQPVDGSTEPSTEGLDMDLGRATLMPAALGYLLKTLEVGEVLRMKNLSVEVELDATSCPLYRYLVVCVRPLHVPYLDTRLNTNCLPTGINLVCQAVTDVVSVIGNNNNILSSQSDVIVTFTAYVNGPVPDYFRYILYLSVDQTVDKDDLVLSVPSSGDRIVGPGLAVRAVNDLTGRVRLPLNLHLSYCGRVFLLGHVDMENHVEETTEDNNLHAMEISVACRVHDLLALVVEYTTAQTMGMIDLNLPSALNLKITVRCVQAPALCPAEASSGQNMKLGFKLYDWDKKELLSLMPGVVDAVNADMYLSNPDVLTGDYAALNSHTTETTGEFLVQDASLCPLVHYLGVTLLKGDSAEIRAKDIGPAASKTRFVPITVNCRPRSIDLEVVSFGVTTINIGAQTFTINLAVDIVSNNWPKRRDYDTIFAYRIFAKVAVDPTLAMDDLGYRASAPIRNLLTSNLATGEFDLTDSAGTADWSKLMRYCGRDDVTLGVFIDSYDNYPETNETNNEAMAEGTIEVTNCHDGVDVSISRFDLGDQEVASGVALSVDVDVTVVTVGQFPPEGVEMPSPLPPLYSVDFALVDSTTDTDITKELALSLTLETPLSGPTMDISSPEETPSGKAVVSKHDLVEITQLPFPTDVVLCDRAWFVRARVQLLDYPGISNDTDRELNTANNVVYIHVYIHCPTDGLGLLAIDIKQLPDPLWSESYDEMYFTYSIINKGAAIPWPQEDITYLLKIRVFFSADAEQNGADEELTVYEGDYLHEYKGRMGHGERIESKPLRVKLTIPSKRLCQDAKYGEAANPSIFFKLEINSDLDALYNPYKGNDVLRFDIKNDSLICNRENVDLSLYAMRVASDYSGEVVAGHNTYFTVEVRQTHTISGYIPALDPVNEYISLLMRLNLSSDCHPDPYDDNLPIIYTDEQRYTLQMGVQSGSASTVELKGKNLLIDIQKRKDLSFYCGRCCLVAEIKDLISNPPIDPVPENNHHAIPINLKCPEDVISFESLKMTLVKRQTKFYPRADTEFDFEARIAFNVAGTKPPSRDERLNIYFRVFMSPDKNYDLSYNPEISATFSHEVLETSKQGLTPGLVRIFRGRIHLHTTLIVCVFRPSFLIVLAQPGAQIAEHESVLYNNYEYIYAKELLNCSISTADIYITDFFLNSDLLIRPGEQIGFNLSVRVDLTGSASLGVEEADQYIFTYQFYLSNDTEVSRDDFNFNYSMADYQNTLKTKISAGANVFTLDASSELLLLPEDVQPKVCGYNYIIAFLDEREEIQEKNEPNNRFAVPVTILCQRDYYSIENVSVVLQHQYFQDPGHIEMSLTVTSLTDDISLLEPGQDTMHFRLYVQSPHPGKLRHDITPETPWTIGGAAVNFTTRPDMGSSRHLQKMENQIDIRSVCMAELDPLEEGLNLLVVELRPGRAGNTPGLADGVPFNNVYVMDINCTCTIKYFDLYVDTLRFLSGSTLQFGGNQFDLKIGVYTPWRFPAWAPSEYPRGQLMFYNFQLQLVTQRTIVPLHPPETVTTLLPVPYNTSGMKDQIDEPYPNGTKINLQDTSPGLELLREDFYLVCVASSIELLVSVDIHSQRHETDEANNDFILSGLAAPVDCDGLDIMVKVFSIPGLIYDTLHPEVAMDYVLDIDVVQLTPSDNLRSSSSPHLIVEFFLTGDKNALRDESIQRIPLSASFSPAQMLSLKESYFGWDVMSLGGSGLTIPLTISTYALCWEPAYVGVMLTRANGLPEINHNNNGALYEVIFDCGDKLDECALGLASCDTTATCHDKPFSLHDTRRGYLNEGVTFNSPDSPRYQCVCSDGFRQANDEGTLCADIPECTELLPDGRPLHTCDAALYNYCVEQEGGFSCACMDGFTMEEGTCQDLDECMDSSHNNCHDNADCINTLGSYNCTCLPGYEGDGTICSDVDDCRNHSCLNGGTCMDGINTYSCQCAHPYIGHRCEQVIGNWGEWGNLGHCDATCGPGLRKRYRKCDDPAPSISCGCKIVDDIATRQSEYCLARTCLPDETEACFPYACPPHSRCYIAAKKSRGCDCHDGYRYNVTTGLCEDVNECAERTAEGIHLHDCCDPNGFCENTDGGFVCNCLSGYSRVGDSCINIDECAVDAPCSSVSEWCQDLPGTYKCMCQAGYLRRTSDSRCRRERMWRHGMTAGDTLLNTTSRLTGELVSPLLIVPQGIPIGDRLPMLLPSLYLTENGVIVASDQTVDTDTKDSFQRPRPLTSLRLPTDRHVHALIAVFWADAKSSCDDSAVWYQAYMDPTHEVFGFVSNLMESLGKWNFTPSYILKVTWANMCPHYQGNQPSQVINFQAFVITDGEHTYAVYLYEDGAMTWVPEYSPREVVQIYQGHPAWVGYAVRQMDNTMMSYQDPNSGYWNNDLLPTSLNVYRMDDRQLKPMSSGLNGTTLIRLDTQPDHYTNPAKRCYQWVMSEPPATEWASGLLGACPYVMMQMQRDHRFIELVAPVVTPTNATNTTIRDGPVIRCFTKLFSLDGGGNVRCCYDNQTGAMIEDNVCSDGSDDTGFQMLGVLHRYEVSDDPASDYQTRDMLPYSWCCLQSMSTTEQDYRRMYREKRPPASSTHYDHFGFAQLHGDPHMRTFDGLSYTTDANSEFVALRRSFPEPAVMIQTRQNKENTGNSTDEAKRTYISAVAVRVGDAAEPSLQVYRRWDRPGEPLEVVVGSEEWTDGSPDPVNVTISIQDDPLTGSHVQFVFRAGLVVRVGDLGGRLRVVVLLPRSLYPGDWEGLLGKPDDDMLNDMKPYTPGGDALPLDPDSSGDIKYIFSLSWGIRYVYSASGDANARSLFSRYGNDYIRISSHQSEITSAAEFVDDFFSPNFYTCTDANDIERQTCEQPEADGTLHCGCLHDMRAADDASAGRMVLDSERQFLQLKEKMDNRRPEFLSSTPRVVHANLGEVFNFPVRVSDPDDRQVTFNYSVKNTEGQELIIQRTTNSTTIKPNTAVFVGPPGKTNTFVFTWRVYSRQPNLIEFSATDSRGSTTMFRPLLVLCDCENGGSCAEDGYRVLRPGFALAKCECSFGRAGDFCELDLDGCSTVCYYGCEDVPADLIGVNYTADTQFLCDPCPPTTETDGNSCYQINECVLEDTDPRADLCDQTCHKYGENYTCSCGPGFDLDPISRTRCLDHPECSSPSLNDCDKVVGVCEDVPPGSYTCSCMVGYKLAPDGHSCIDVDECRTNNGGCEGSCINTPGSFKCKCPAGSKVNQNSPKYCLPVNECNDGSANCDHMCEDTKTGYDCHCEPGFLLQSDRTSCQAQSPCVAMQCGPNAYCELGSQLETCHCHNGFRLIHGNLTHCEDIDECTHKTDKCDVQTSVCVNTPGKYRCQCRPGYQQANNSTFICENVDECTELSPAQHGCPMLCHDIPGSYRCACSPGYILVNTNGTWSCEDVNECSPGQHNPCDPHADCINEMGYYRCTCRQGYIGNGAICIEDQECAVSNGGCQLRCRDVADTYLCECIEGYKKNDTTTCEDINECLWPEPPCTHTCTNIPGSYICSCHRDFTLADDRSTCLPDRPCDEMCGNGVCEITAGGDKRCSCYSGSNKLSGRLNECRDLKECYLRRDECALDGHTTCVNQRNGRAGYKCQCEPGYTSNGDMLSCEDINECFTEVSGHQHTCDLKVSTCLNTQGSYDCICSTGYNKADNGSCVDEDECAYRRSQAAPCDDYHRADCINTGGGYLCQCKAGYQGDGFTCQDIDECKYMGSCGSMEVCVNTIGSYQCECQPGYQYVNGRCEDIDECYSASSVRLSECNRLCRNTPGSYRCNCYTTSAREHLTNDGLTCLVKRPCKDVDMHGRCSGVCLNGDNGDRCLCSWPLTTQCEDLDECDDAGRWCNLTHSTCRNKHAGYFCDCQPGWLPDADGRGCSETNGNWAAWSPWTTCSARCAGCQQRKRTCTNPPPVGRNRNCVGVAGEDRPCNRGKGQNCHVHDPELDGVFLDWRGLKPCEYHKITHYVHAAVAILINDKVVREQRDNDTYTTYKMICGGLPSNREVPDTDLVAHEDVVLGKTYPRSLNNGSRVLINVARTERTAAFCNNTLNDTTSTSTDSNSNSSLPAVVGRRRRAVTVNGVTINDVTINGTSNSTYVTTTLAPEVLQDDFLSGEFLLAVLNISELYMILDELLYDARMSEYLDLLFPVNILEAYDPRTPTTAPPPVVTEKPPILPIWAFIVIGVGLGLLLIIVVIVVIVYCVVIKGRKKRKHKGDPLHPVTQQPLTEEQKRLVRQRVRERRMQQRQLDMAAGVTLAGPGGADENKQDGRVDGYDVEGHAVKIDGAELGGAVATSGGVQEGMEMVEQGQQEEDQREGGQLEQEAAQQEGGELEKEEPQRGDSELEKEEAQKEGDQVEQGEAAQKSEQGEPQHQVEQGEDQNENQAEDQKDQPEQGEAQKDGEQEETQKEDQSDQGEAKKEGTQPEQEEPDQVPGSPALSHQV